MAATLHTLSSPVYQSLFHPTEEHHMLREMVADFARKCVADNLSSLEGYVDAAPVV